jgi:hypothetical protein
MGIVDRYLDNPNLDVSSLAKLCGVSRKKVDEELDLYFRLRDMQIVPSLDLPNTYYLFTQFGEKKIEVLCGEIPDTSNLTEYELKFSRLWICNDKR